MFCLTFQEVPQNLANSKTFPYRTVSMEQREYTLFMLAASRKEHTTILIPRIFVIQILHNILEPVLGRPSKKESKTTLIPKIW
jgi:hypothetical protein